MGSERHETWNYKNSGFTMEFLMKLAFLVFRSGRRHNLLTEGSAVSFLRLKANKQIKFMIFNEISLRKQQKATQLINLDGFIFKESRD